MSTWKGPPMRGFTRDGARFGEVAAAVCWREPPEFAQHQWKLTEWKHFTGHDFLRCKKCRRFWTRPVKEATV